MMWIAVVAVAVYLALKSGQFAFLGRASGYRAEPVSMGRRLRQGEPILLVVAALITVPPALAARRYHKHKFEKMLTDAVACYSLVQVYQDAPEVKRTNDSYAIYETLNGLRSTAFGASQQLGLIDAATKRRLDEHVKAMAAEVSHADMPVRRAKISATQSCLHPPPEPPNA